MKVAHHLLLGAAVGAGLALNASVLNAAAFFTASILIDTDHYIDFVWHSRFQNFSVRGMFRFCALMRQHHHRKEFLVLHVFHTIEFLAALAIAAFFLQNALLHYVLYGMLFHLACDWLSIVRKRIIFGRAMCIVEYIVRKRQLLSYGLSPTPLLCSVADEVLEEQNRRT